MLIEHCRERLRELGARWWTVSVVAANGRAAELYEREGFRPFIDHLRAPVG
jgi:ribosomal protein S18 acetylase RimI-like enzyme